MVSLFSLAMLLFTVEYCFDMLEMDYMEMLFVDRLWMVKIITRHCWHTFECVLNGQIVLIGDS